MKRIVYSALPLSLCLLSSSMHGMAPAPRKPITLEAFLPSALQNVAHEETKPAPARTIADVFDDLKKIERATLSKEQYNDQAATLYYELANFPRVKRHQRDSFLQKFEQHTKEKERLKRQWTELDTHFEEHKKEGNLQDAVDVCHDLIALVTGDSLREARYHAELDALATRLHRVEIEKAITSLKETNNVSGLIAAYTQLMETFDTPHEKEEVITHIGSAHLHMANNDIETFIAGKKNLSAQELHELSILIQKRATLARQYSGIGNAQEDTRRARLLHFEALGSTKDKTLEEKIRTEFKS